MGQAKLILCPKIFWDGILLSQHSHDHSRIAVERREVKHSCLKKIIFFTKVLRKSFKELFTKLYYLISLIRSLKFNKLNKGND